MSESVLIAGCGAVGSVFAGLLAATGRRVTVLGRRAHVHAIAEHGIRISGIWGDHCGRGICAAERASDLEASYDAILVTCKSYQTDALLADLVGNVDANEVVVALQNGLGNFERLQRAYGGERVLAGRVIFGARLVAPGHACVTVEAEPVLLGHPTGGIDDRTHRWATILDSSGIHCTPSGSIVGAIWGKAFYNAALNPLGALLGMSYGELASDHRRREIMNLVIGEGFRVATAEGVSLGWRDVGEYLSAFYSRLIPATADHRSSMLQDIEKGRPTEIDAICGEICRRGEVHAIDTPLNGLLAMLVGARTHAASACGPWHG